MEFSHIIQLFETDRTFVENFSEVVILLDEKFTIQYWNSSAARLYGYSHQEAMGMAYNSLLPNQESFHMTQKIILELDSDTEWRGSLIHKRKDHTIINCMSSIVSLQRDNEHFQYLFVCIDITEKKEFINTLEKMQGKTQASRFFKEVEMTHRIGRTIYGFFSFDRNWNYVHLNDKASKLFHKKAEELIGKNVWVEFPDWVNSIYHKTYQQAFETNEKKYIKAYSALTNTWYETNVYPTEDHLFIFFQDMFETRVLKEKGSIKNSKNDNTPNQTEGIWIIDADNKTVFMNSYLSKKLGYERNEITGTELHSLVASEFIGTALQNLEKRKTGISEQYDIKLKSKGNEAVWVSLQANPIFNKKKYVGSLAFVRNIAERIENEIELNKSRQELRELAAKLQTIREEERASIAREIHDDLAQQLTAIKMDIYWLANKLNTDDIMVKQKTDQMLTSVNKTLDQLRKKAIDLHPSLLDNLGLVAAIEWQNNEFYERYGIQISFSSSDIETTIPKDIALAFYRIYQEALSNITKHSHATAISSSFIHNKKGYYLSIMDNGKGFELNTQDHYKSLGLLSMKERSIAIGGQWSIRSILEKGTTVSVFIELEV